jgi:hypothetical protein
MGLLEDDVLDRLLADLCQEHASVSESRGLSSPFDFHFSIRCTLPPKAIVSHRRPHHVIDAIYGNHIGSFEASERAMPDGSG